MKRLLVLSLLGAFACSAYAADTKDTTAATPTKANPQQEKMKMCQSQATDKKLEGQARKDFVNNCLKAKPETTAEKPKSKMAMCNEKTAGMKADERAKAQSECMKGS